MVYKKPWPQSMKNKFNLRIHKNLGVKMVDAKAASSGGGLCIWKIGTLF